MQRPLLVTFVAAAASCSGLMEAADAASRPASPQAPQIIQGIGPEEAAQLDLQPAPQAALQPIMQPAAQAPQAQPVRIAAANTSRYGGGFIEMLMTRGSAAPAPQAAAPQYPSGIPGQVLYSRPPAQHAALGPQAPLKRAMDPKYIKQEVDYSGGHRPGTVVIDTPNHFLYLVEGNGRALRYGIGVGRPGFEWSGVKNISRKAEWPAWTPPPDMLLRRPDLPRHMEGGADNPLGARAMYLGSSLYRIHGTNEPDTIGTNVSSGCIRLTNDDVTDLFDRVRVGAKVVVM